MGKLTGVNNMLRKATVDVSGEGMGLVAGSGVLCCLCRAVALHKSRNTSTMFSYRPLISVCYGS